MLQGRANKSIKNMLYGMGGLIINLVLSFVAKSVFIANLGIEFNGVNALFSNILSVLNLAELGLAGSIAFALYKPLANGDEREIAALMNFFAKVYRIIAATVAVIGLAIVPILQFLIKEDMASLPFSINELRIYFVFYLANTCLSYLLAYKRTVITADQKSYIVSIVDNVSNIILTILQIVLLITTKNYYAFLTIMLVRTVVNNIIIQLIANKKYPYITKYKECKLEKNMRSDLFKSVKALSLHRIGTVVITSTVTLVISTFIGLKIAGMYSNYGLLIGNVSIFVNMIFGAVTASVGSLCVSQDIDKQMKILKMLDYLAICVANFVVVSYLVLLNPFIKLWIGEINLLPMAAVLVMSLSSYVNITRKAVLSFRDAKGLFVKDRYRPLVEAAVGLGLSIGLSYVWGLAGVLLGYLIAVVVVAYPTEVYVLYKYGLQNEPMKKKFIFNVVMLILTSAIAALTYFISYIIPVGGVGGLIIKFGICAILPNILFVAVTFKTEGGRLFFDFIIGKFRSRKKPPQSCDGATGDAVGAVDIDSIESGAGGGDSLDLIANGEVDNVELGGCDSVQNASNNIACNDNSDKH